MKSLMIIFLFLFALMVFSCAKSDSGGKQEETKSTAPAVQADSALVDSVVSDLQKTTDELKNDADELQKAADDLLK